MHAYRGASNTHRGTTIPAGACYAKTGLLDLSGASYTYSGASYIYRGLPYIIKGVGGPSYVGVGGPSYT